MADIIIVGAGPAGLSAAIYARRAGMNTVVYEAESYGGQIINTPEIENYPAIAKISGFDFADMNYTNDNYDAGVRCGRALGEWINETFGEDYNIKIGQSTYDQIPEVTQRTDGQIDGLTEVHPNFELVATDHPTDSSTAMSETENMLTANPDIEALFCWGDSMALGTLEAVRSMGYDESKFGIVSVDGTDEAVAEIAAGSALKMSCSLGGPIVQGDQQFDMMKEWIAGTNEDHYYSPNIAITYKNVEEYLAGGEVSTEAE